ncbi:protein Skeletor, isoforms B/C-like, partial [Limulus polyphemus]|uniref:Protein Skeletor, isoforms B/C-like n=1 Tax=Limulus polyphemus TaxID=6850 RepID=A0ABM1T3E3_LIMPO
MDKITRLLFLSTFFFAVEGDTTKYFGKYIADFKTNAHGVTGKAYAASSTTFYISEFYYDGKGSDAFFWVGNTENPSPQGEIVPNELGSQENIGTYTNRNITITLPTGRTINQFKWLSVWSRQEALDYGHALIPRDFVPPVEQSIGPIKSFAHGVRADSVVIKDSKTIYLSNFYYDGSAPDTYFLVGSGKPNGGGTKVPDETGSLSKIKGYNGKNVSLRLPGTLTVFDINWLSIYCILASESFGQVDIPDRQNLNVPADLKELKDVSLNFKNCEELFPGLMQVSWIMEGESIIIQLEGKVGENEYLAFGRSGNEDKVEMTGADVILAFYDKEKSMARVVDYFINSKSQCTGTSGVCPDVRFAGKEDAVLITWQRINGILKVVYKRLLKTGDARDQEIPSSGGMTIVAAVGNLNSQMEAAYHSRAYLEDTIRIDFGRNPVSKCSLLEGKMDKDKKDMTPWKSAKISGVTEFRAQIGPSGGAKGYTAITGVQSWGVAWWINGLLIPEITVERYQNYTFIIEGGEDPSNTAKYHPLYITNNPEGGGSQVLDQLNSS